MAATIKDIAKMAGVSITTVSRALNNHTDVNRNTYKKIIKIAKQLNYQPNSSARNLVLKKTNTIGLVISGLTTRSGHHFIYDVICGINEQAKLRNYDVLLIGTSTQQQKEISFKDLCLKRNFDGVILAGVRTGDPYIEQAMQSDIPTVIMGVPVATAFCGSVVTEDVSGAFSAVQHLIDFGHRHILFINGHKETVVSQFRLEGYIKALNKNGIPYNDNYVAHANFEIEGGSQALESLLSHNPEATAVFCASDLMAYGAMMKCMELGFKVPDDISIIGFDGIDITEIVKPCLTTIYQDRWQMGISAVNMLLELLGGSEGYIRFMSPKLVIRESTKMLIK
ncbi:transcriptional regulator, LacI family [Paenibacillus sp. yr247]|uniref:LacI family DNA-binding transcriptional regulator n=1 Tax=Paenibacillus sp. yr247 TaxID=1761880 RepID=UPI000886746E|nr:LacI family DNA-binding transcriptional regulator [Paenibacillus sp. yr247]SDN95909.1 transcriptional regulator, LacI family [Paenibacillus sp. yr247]